MIKLIYVELVHDLRLYNSLNITRYDQKDVDSSG
jgi:hypothetical protein